VSTPLSLKRRVPSRLTGLRARASRRIGHLLIRPRVDDSYLYAYPRSGSTWMQTILANLIDPTIASHPDRRNSLIPGVTIRNARQINALPSPRVIKSHGRYLGRVPRALYLVRDGRDVLVSLYHYRVTRPGLGDRMSFPEFCRGYFRGDLGDLWHENVLSFLRAGTAELGDSLRVLRFEDLKRDLVTQVAELGRFLGIPSELARVTEAVEQASLDRLQAIERDRRGDLGQKTFYRGGATGQWREMLTGPLLDRFLELSAPALVAAGYEV
jgi:hypothetical protein